VLLSRWEVEKYGVKTIGLGTIPLRRDSARSYNITFGLIEWGMFRSLRMEFPGVVYPSPREVMSEEGFPGSDSGAI
jgi:hypothetical protein